MFDRPFVDGEVSVDLDNIEDKNRSDSIPFIVEHQEPYPGSRTIVFRVLQIPSHSFSSDFSIFINQHHDSEHQMGCKTKNTEYVGEYFSAFVIVVGKTHYESIVEGKEDIDDVWYYYSDDPNNVDGVCLQVVMDRG